MLSSVDKSMGRVGLNRNIWWRQENLFAKVYKNIKPQHGGNWCEGDAVVENKNALVSLILQFLLIPIKARGGGGGGGGVNTIFSVLTYVTELLKTNK